MFHSFAVLAICDINNATPFPSLNDFLEAWVFIRGNKKEKKEEEKKRNHPAVMEFNLFLVPQLNYEPHLVSFVVASKANFQTFSHFILFLSKQS